MNIKKDKIEKAFSNCNVILLENLRFFKEEESNDDSFSKKLSSFADIYVNESFSTCHRKHASIIGISKFLPSFPGMLLEKEVSNLKKLITTANYRLCCSSIWWFKSFNQNKSNRILFKKIW